MRVPTSVRAHFGRSTVFAHSHLSFERVCLSGGQASMRVSLFQLLFARPSPCLSLIIVPPSLLPPPRPCVRTPSRKCPCELTVRPLYLTRSPLQCVRVGSPALTCPPVLIRSSALRFFSAVYSAIAARVAACGNTATHVTLIEPPKISIGQ